MDRYRLAYALTAAGGILGAAMLPAAIASADPFDASSYTLEPVAPETVIGFYNITTAPPGINESL